MFAALLVLATVGELKLPAFLSDHLVLQRETHTALWGWCDPGASVELGASWGQKARGTADAQGRWRVELATPAAGGPFEITIRAGKAESVLHDVLVGEVWLASGQSNMELSVGPVVGPGVENWEATIAASADDALRFFDVANEVDPAPRSDVKGSWKVANPANTQAFSATAYFFAHRLRAELGVPVGVIEADWGGTPAEAWTRSEGFQGFPEFAEVLAREAASARDPKGEGERLRVLGENYWRHAQELDSGKGLADAALERCDESRWQSVTLPATWEQHGLADFDGLVWYRRTFDVPLAWAGKALVLELGAIDDRDTAFWNGMRVGGTEDDGAWQTPRHYVVPAQLVKGGLNTLALRVLDTGGAGGFTSPAAALRIFPEADEAKPEEHALTLAGNWRWKKGTALAEIGRPPSRDAFGPDSPSVLWNAMVAPLVSSAIRGAIWYQGEANCGRADQYITLFPNMIREWRAAFGRGDFPFYFVQIAPYGYGGDTGEAARLRDAQRRALSVPNTGMAVTMDIGNPTDIHPLKKREVGERLALWALAHDYGRSLECSGPLYRSQKVEGATMRLGFEHAAGLTTHGKALEHFTIAGADRVFHPASARIEGESVFVSSPDVPAPKAVRFGWGAADETALWNAAGLPAASFRSDDWP